MRRIYIFSSIIIFILFSIGGHAQNIGINADGSTPNDNAMLDIKASNKGILIPRTSTTSRLAIPNTKGLLVYDTTLASFWYNDGVSWQQLANGALNGSTNILPKFTGPNTIGNSQIFDNGTAISMGDAVSAQGTNSFAEGNGSTAVGDYSFAEGFNCNAGGKNSIAMGFGSVASGVSSFAAGYNCNATNVASIAVGESLTASGSASFTTGFSNNASGDISFVAGSGNQASGLLSMTMGRDLTSTGYNSMLFGTDFSDGGHKGDVMFGDSDPWKDGNVGSGTDDQMICRFSNGYYFLTSGNTNRSGMIANHGDNSWSQISDSTKKEKLIPVNGEELLKKISNFKLTTWNYKGQDAKVFRHYGPMAQDFHNAFGHDAIGTIGNDTLINQADFLGVSFNAIQALEKRTEKIEQQQQQINNLQKQNETLSASNEKLQQQLQTLLSTVAAMDKKVETLVSIENKNNAVAKK